MQVKLPGDNPAAVWNAMTDRLNNHQDITGAISYFSFLSADRYRDAFVSIGMTDLAADIAQIGPITPVFIDADTAQYRFDQVLSGFTIMFLIDFVKENGLWKIEEF